MPIYEYLCRNCHRRVSILVRNTNDPKELICTFCQSDQLSRIMSRFASLKSEEDRLETMADPVNWSGLDESDPKSIANFVKKMGSEMGDDMSRDEIDQMADEAAREAESGFSGSGDVEPPDPSVGEDES